MSDLFTQQIQQLRQPHFLILYWTAQAEGKDVRYNITNAFDDLKLQRLTRTKQTAVACVEALALLCFISLRDESNRKNLYITKHGAKALEALIQQRTFKTLASNFLEDKA